MKELESERPLDNELENQGMPEGVEALSDEDLEEVAGGWDDETPPPPPPTGGG